MTRRILAAFLGVTLAVLIGVVIPLGLMTARQERQSFADQTVSAASAVASAAEEQLADHERFFGAADLAVAGPVAAVLPVPALGCGLWVAE